MNETKEAKEFRLKLGVIRDGDRVRGIFTKGLVPGGEPFEGVIETKWFTQVLDGVLHCRVIVKGPDDMQNWSMIVKLTDIHEIL